MCRNGRFRRRFHGFVVVDGRGELGRIYDVEIRLGNFPFEWIDVRRKIVNAVFIGRLSVRTGETVVRIVRRRS